MVAMPHGRAQVQYVELGARRDGRIVGLRVRVVGDAGAYAGFGGALAIGPTRTMAQGVYRIPALGYDVAVALTNTTPVGAFRGAGRPEAAAFLERIMDMTAVELGLDPAVIRRRNFIAPDQFPFTTQVGTTYDCGDYDAPLTEALRIAGYDELRAEQARRRAAGERWSLGIGISTYVEITAGGGGSEFGAVAVHPDGSATIRVGTSAHGQGHATSFGMLVADTLGIPLESVRFVQSDTATGPTGGGTGGSRSLQLGGSAVHTAAEKVLEQASELAAALLEADVHDIVPADGGLGVAGVPDRTVGWPALATAAEEQHGGCAQGIAQALWEHVEFDPDGNPLTATLADYAMPSAADLCGYEVANTQTPTPLNPLGAKGIGESATVGSTPAVQNAVVDALAHLGVRHVNLPCTPQRVWRAIRDAGSTDPWREPPAVFATLPVRAAATSPEAAEVDI
jgi:carbon-monoxide dehydrogenase large subunit